MKKRKLPDDGSTARHVEILKALANPTRLRIVQELRRSDMTVTDIAAALELRQCMVSQQLGILRMSGIAAGEHERGFTKYSLVEPLVRNILGAIDEA